MRSAKACWFRGNLSLLRWPANSKSEKHELCHRTVSNADAPSFVCKPRINSYFPLCVSPFTAPFRNTQSTIPAQCRLNCNHINNAQVLHVPLQGEQPSLTSVQLKNRKTKSCVHQQCNLLPLRLSDFLSRGIFSALHTTLSASNDHNSSNLLVHPYTTGRLHLDEGVFGDSYSPRRLMYGLEQLVRVTSARLISSSQRRCSVPRSQKELLRASLYPTTCHVPPIPHHPAAACPNHDLSTTDDGHLEGLVRTM